MSQKEEDVMKNSKSILLAIAAMVIVIAVLWFTNRAVTPKEATWEDVLAEGRHGGYQIIKTRGFMGALPKRPQQYSAGGYPPGVGISDRAYQRRCEFSRGAHLVVPLAKRKTPSDLPGSGQKPFYCFLLSRA